MDWAAVFSTVTQAIGLAKSLKEINTEFDLAAMKANAADLYGRLADVKMALTDAQNEMRKKDDEIARFQEAFRFRGELVECRGYKYEILPDHKPRGLPFCPRCETNKGRYYRLTRSSQLTARGDCECPECKAQFRAVEIFPWE